MKMRATRYLWISNLPVRTSEQDVRDVLQSHGKIQSIRIHSGETTYSAVVAFVDTKSATRAVESTVRLNKTKLSLQYCESCGVPGNTSQESVGASTDSSLAVSSVVQNEENNQITDNRSLSGMSDSGSSTQERRKKQKTSSRSGSPRTNFNGSTMSVVSAASTGRYEREQRGLQVRHLPVRSSDTNLREGLFHEYKKHGKITSVVIRGQGEDRYCIITFKRAEDAERAFQVSRGKVFFGTPISVALHEGLDSEDPDLCPPEHALDEYHPKATKTLFVGNLSSNTITQDELRRTFRTYGEIIEIDIKIQANQPGTSYAFVQFSDIKSVVRALSNQETIRVNGKPVKLGFGKSQPTNVVWLDNLAPSVNEAFLVRQFGRYGHLTHVVLDRKSLRALLYFDTVEMAQRALNETRNRALIGRKVQLDYAGYECQVAFVRRLTKHDGFSQVYDNYREKIQELLTLWPSYGGVLPLMDRQRYFGDVDKECVHDDDCGHSGTYRSTSRRMNRGDRNTSDYSVTRTRDRTSTSRHRSLKDQYGPSYSRHHPSTKEDNVDTSPVSDIHSHTRAHTRRSHGHSSHYKLSASIPENRAMGSPRRNASEIHEAASRSSRQYGLVSKSVRTGQNSANSCSNSRQTSHYLNETDDVSSGSLSLDLEVDESNSDDSPMARSSLHNKNQRLPTSVPGEFASIKRQTPPFTCGLKNVASSRAESTSREYTHSHSHKSYAKSYRDSVSPIHVAKKLRSTDTNRLSCHVHTQQSCLVRTPASPRSLLNREFVDRSSPSPSRELYSEQPVKRSSKLLESSSEVKMERGSRSKERLLRCYYSDEKSLRAQPADLCSESHDTLTKLELERAKLLRELSLLNNEVGSHKTKSSTSTRKRSAPNASDEPYSIKMKRSDPLHSTDVTVKMTSNPVDPHVGISGCSDHIPISVADNHHTVQSTGPVTGRSGHSSMSRPSNGCHSSSSEQENLLSPLALTRTTTLTVPDMYPVMDTSRPIEYRPPTSNVVSCPMHSRRPVATTSSPRLMMPPEPTSPLTHLSSPGSPPSAVDIPLSTMGSITTASSCHMKSPISASSLGRRSISSPTQYGPPQPRDPRLMAHQAMDIPPPPPECLKLPLWVDTSQIDIPPADKVLQPVSKTPCSTQVTGDILEPTNCSLDERIRQLDAQLLKSERTRPAVDYSKFKIRRKVDPSVSGLSIDRQAALSSPMASTSLNPTLSSSPISDLSSTLPSRIDRVLVSDCTATPVITATSTINFNSPRLSCSSSPISLLRHTDTSEFVKSMLSSSKPSPSSHSDHPVVSVLDIPTSRPITRYTSDSSPLSVNTTLESNVKVTSMVGVQSGITSFATHQFGSLSTKIMPSSVGSYQSSLNSDHSIGGAAKMPPIPSSNSNVRPSNESAQTHSEGSHVKSILKKDPTYLCDSSISNSPKQFSVSVDQSVTSHMASSNVCSFQNAKKRLTDIECKSEKSSEQGLKVGSSNGSARQPTTSKSSKQICSEVKKTLTVTQTGGKSKTVKIDSIVVPGSFKPTKADASRSVLDDSMFKTSLESPGSKIEKKRNRTEAPQGRVRSIVQSIKPDISSTSLKCDSSILRDPASETRRTSVQPSKHTCESDANDRVPLFEKRQTSLLSTEKGASPIDIPTKDVKLSRSHAKSSQDDRLACAASNLTTKRKPRDGRKRIVEDDSDGDEVESKTPVDRLEKNTDAVGTVSGYESMYDKIKRRANKYPQGEKRTEKTGAFKRLMKVRGKTRRQAVKHNHKRLESSIDSDTDECLSNASCTDEDSKSKRERGKTGSRQAKAPETTDRIGRQRPGNAKSKNVQLWSTISCIKKGRCSEGNLDSKTKGKFSRTKSDKIRKQKELTSAGPIYSLNTGTVKKTKNALRAKSITKMPRKDHDSLNAAVSSTKNKTTKRSSKSFSSCSGERKQLKTVRKHSKLLNTEGEKPRSLVHRMFASTDSETPSLSSSDTDLEESAKELSLSKREQIVSHSRSSTPKASRSCSPDDLDADDAIRHTFGAFSKSLNSDSPRLCVSPPAQQETSANSKCITPTDTQSLKSLSEASTLIPKSTPPTLPMIDSSSSVDQPLDSQTPRPPGLSSEWNIFTSLSSHTLPVIEPYPRASTPTALLGSVSNLSFGEQNGLGAEKSVSDAEDELPSLEKHDEDESSKLDTGSLLLNDSVSLLNPISTANNVDDDLPPPVVSAVVDLSPNPLVGAPTEVIKDIAPDVIEEVVYDGLEVPLVSCDATEDDLKPETLTDNGQLIQEGSISSGATVSREQNILYSSPTISANDAKNCQSSPCDHAFVSEELDQRKQSVASLSSTALTLPSTVFTPIAMLTPSSHAGELPTVEQSLLVTVPGSTAGVTFTSPGLALLPAPLPTSPTPLSKSAQVPRHVALILPATSISLSGPISSSHASVTTSVLPSSNLVYTTSTANSPGSAQLAVRRTSNIHTTAPNISARAGQEQSVTLVKSIKPPSSSDVLCVSSDLLPSGESSGDTCSVIGEGLHPPLHTTTHDPPDYTTYVQSVIERVKQEKDEEVSHQREKVKRPKKFPLSLTSVPCSNAVTNSVIVALTANVSSSQPNSLTPIAPMPTLSSVIPKVSCAKLGGTYSADNSGHCTSFRRLSETKHPNNTELVIKGNGSVDNETGAGTSSQTENFISSTVSSTGTLSYDRLGDELSQPDPAKSSVDEVIDAVLDGQFDENEYVEKILKGTFDQISGSCRSELFSSGFVVDPKSPPRTIDDTSKLDSNTFGQDTTSQRSTNIKSMRVTVPVQNSSRCMNAESSPSQVFTPMHVLTLVATNAATPQKVNSISAISPNTPQPLNPSTMTLPPSLSQCVKITTTESSGSSSLSGGCASGSNFSGVGSLPVSGIEQLAAQFPNNPLTSYIYSILTHQPIGRSSPQVDSAVCKAQESGVSHVSSALENSLKGLTKSTAGDEAGYLAVAMAAMAAITSTGARTSTSLDPQPSTGGIMTSLPFSPSREHQSTSAPVDQSLAHEYHVSWRGRLSLKNEEVHVQMHYLSGNEDLLKTCLSVIAEQQALAVNTLHANFDAALEGAILQPLKIMQRMRLEPSQLEGVQRKLRQASDYCMCLTLATAPPGIPEESVPSERMRMNRILCDGFIKYMVDKCAAGIINVCHPSTQQNLFVIHIFPPCEFSRSQLDGCAPNLLCQLTQSSTPHLLVVVTTV